MKIKVLVIVGLLSSLANAQQTSAPFGIPMNAAKQQIVKLGGVFDDKNGNWRLTNPPIPNAGFESYLIKYSDKYGICQITAVGKDILSSEYGDAVKSQFSAMRKIVQNKYGSDKNYDFLHAGSIWDEDKYWMRSLEQDERSLVSFWNKGANSKLPNDIGEIVLSANALSSTKGFLRLSYRSPNYEACADDVAKPSNDGL